MLILDSFCENLLCLCCFQSWLENSSKLPKLRVYGLQFRFILKSHVVECSIVRFQNPVFTSLIRTHEFMVYNALVQHQFDIMYPQIPSSFLSAQNSHTLKICSRSGVDLVEQKLHRVLGESNGSYCSFVFTTTKTSLSGMYHNFNFWMINQKEETLVSKITRLLSCSVTQYRCNNAHKMCCNMVIHLYFN